MLRKIVSLIALVFLSYCSSLKDRTPDKVLVPLAKGETREKHEAFGDQYMIATQGTYSTAAGKEMFRQGGNIMDAAVAISFAISVERPQSTGIGGGGFMLYYSPEMEKPIALDFREKAPLNSHEKIYLDDEGNEIARLSIDGIFAVGVPGLVAGVLEAHKKYGSLPLEKILRPSIELAEKGFKVYPELAKALEYRKEVLGRFQASKKIFLKTDGSPLKEGDLLIQKDLGKTLRRIAKSGLDGFYKGPVSEAIVEESDRLKGLITQEDLDKYNVKYREPIKGTFKGHEIFSMSPPSSGGTHIVQILNILENDNLGEQGILDPKTIHLTASAMQRAFRDRADFMADSDFVEVPLEVLTSKRYAKDMRSKIPERHALSRLWVSGSNPKRYALGDDRVRSETEFYDKGNDRGKKEEEEKGFFSNFFNSKDKKPGTDLNFYDRKKKKVKKEHSETTHFSVMDSKGRVVVSTQTINGYFGSGVVVPGTGIVLNNEMDDFSTKAGAANLFGAVGSAKNLVQPEKRPLSSMSPTIVFKEGKPLLALGTPSGTRILTCVAQTILNYVEHKLPLYDAVAALRYHHQWSPDELYVEGEGFPYKVYESLKIMQHRIAKKDLGCRIQAVALEQGRLHGVSDPRGQGESAGL